MAETTYKIVWQRGPTYAVDVTEPDGRRRTVSPFEREVDAHAWIAEAKWKAALGTSERKPQPPKKPD